MRLDHELQHEDDNLLPFEGCHLFWSFKGFKYALAEADDEDLERSLEAKVNFPFFFPFFITGLQSFR